MSVSRLPAARERLLPPGRPVAPRTSICRRSVPRAAPTPSRGRGDRRVTGRRAPTPHGRRTRPRARRCAARSRAEGRRTRSRRARRRGSPSVARRNGGTIPPPTRAGGRGRDAARRVRGRPRPGRVSRTARRRRPARRRSPGRLPACARVAELERTRVGRAPAEALRAAVAPGFQEADRRPYRPAIAGL